jgi:quercetin dioxygenase-like cupin family protein
MILGQETRIRLEQAVHPPILTSNATIFKHQFQRRGKAVSATENFATSWTAAGLEQRVVRYADLVPCYNAFIDTRSPGSEAKENFTIVGPGVSENPAQFVHIPEPHGYNIGGARQPPGCVNSQHSHESAEVFVVHSGRWRFDLGEHGEDAQVELAPGDVISLPVRMFRGFTNIGEESGFLFAVLGGDDPGRVTWAPKVFEMAKDYGLALLDSGRLVDLAAGETVPDGARLMPPTSPEDAARMRRVSPEEAGSFVVRSPGHQPGSTRIIGKGAALGWSHGFTLDRLVLAAGQSEQLPAGKSVLFVQEGELDLDWGAADSLSLATGDTISVPADLCPTVRATGGATLFVVRGEAESTVEAAE